MSYGASIVRSYSEKISALNSFSPVLFLFLSILAVLGACQADTYHVVKVRKLLPLLLRLAAAHLTVAYLVAFNSVTAVSAVLILVFRAKDVVGRLFNGDFDFFFKEGAFIASILDVYAGLVQVG